LKFVLLSLFITQIAQASLESQMKIAGDNLSRLLVLASRPQDYKAQSNAKTIDEGLSSLLKTFKDNKHHFKDRTPHWEMNHEMLVRLTLQTQKAFKLDRKEVSRQMLNSIPALCVSCHQNDNLKSQAFDKKIPGNLNNLQKAEFAQATRQPDLAQTYLKEFLEQKNLDPMELTSALRYKLHLEIAQNRSASDMISDFVGLLKKINQREHTRLLEGWIKGLENASESLPAKLKKIEEIPALLKKSLGTETPIFGLLANPEDEVVYLYLKRLIVQLMGDLKGEKLAEAYYWISFCERAVGYNFYFSLADSYLTTCMNKWPRSKIAKKCYQEYESFIEFAYSGSAGTQIPQDVKQELDSYKKKVKP
jgi:hypothetical protein